MRAEAAAVVLHIGRSWSGHDIEDGCPCPKAPCGLVVTSSVAPDCREHGYVNGAKSMRQGHAASRCPAVAALEPHHRAARSRTEGEAEALGVPDTPTEGRSAGTRGLKGVSRGPGAESQMPIPGVRGGRRAENGAGPVVGDPRAASGALSATDGGGS